MQAMVLETHAVLGDLEIRIRVARRTMERLWEERGGTDEDVLAASVALDQLLNQYQRLLYDTEYIE